MAADINTQLQNISTDVTAIGNLVNRLTTIFSAGGVANPDLAVAKSELQAWVNNQGFASIMNPVFTGTTMTLSNTLSAVLFKGANAYDGTNTVGDRNIAYNDSGSTILSRIIFSANSGRGGTIFLRCFNASDSSSFSDSAMHGLPNGDINFYYFSVPTIPVASKSLVRTGAVNITYLDTVGNGVVHADGVEVIPGYKLFTGNPQFQCNAASASSNTVYPLTCQAMTDISSLESAADFLTIPFYAKLSSNNLQVGMQSFAYDPTEGVIKLQLAAYKGYTSSNKVSLSLVSGSANKAAYMLLAGNMYIQGSVLPDGENRTLGNGANKFSAVYAINGTIQTSDERAKTEIQAIPEAVFRAWGRVNFQQFKMTSSVAEKGLDKARIHFGVIAQRIKEEFVKEGLDPTKYGLYCYDSWDTQYESVEIVDVPEQTKELKIIDKSREVGVKTVIDKQAVYDNNGNVISQEISHEEEYEIAPEIFHMEQQTIPAKIHYERRVIKEAGEIYSVRYDECFALECAYQRWRLSKIEAKLGL